MNVAGLHPDPCRRSFNTVGAPTVVRVLASWRRRPASCSSPSRRIQSSLRRPVRGGVPSVLRLLFSLYPQPLGPFTAPVGSWGDGPAPVPSAPQVSRLHDASTARIKSWRARQSAWFFFASVVSKRVRSALPERPPKALKVWIERSRAGKLLAASRRPSHSFVVNEPFTRRGYESRAGERAPRRSRLRALTVHDESGWAQGGVVCAVSPIFPDVPRLCVRWRDISRAGGGGLAALSS